MRSVYVRVKLKQGGHETTDRTRALIYWTKRLKIDANRLLIRIKRNKISTNRRNTGNDYVGLIRITIRASTDLNRQIAGWINGMAVSIGE
jgi:hypothetical protein